MMVMTMILHIFRVYLTGGFKKPRELTWVTGVILSVLTVSFGGNWLFFTLGSNWLLGC
jgi:cytochrome b6